MDYPSHTRARTADNLFWRHHVSPTGTKSSPGTGSRRQKRGDMAKSYRHRRRWRGPALGGLAEFERELIRARTGEGRKRAKERGVKFGRPAKLTAHQRREAMQRLADGAVQADLARSYGVSQATISRLAAPNPEGLKDRRFGRLEAGPPPNPLSCASTSAARVAATRHKVRCEQ